MQPGTTTEDQFRNWVSEASIYLDTIAKKEVIIRRCGWVVTEESKTEYGTIRYYWVIHPVSTSEANLGERSTILYYASFKNGVLYSLRTP